MTKKQGVKARIRQAAQENETSYTTSFRAAVDTELGWLDALIRRSAIAGTNVLLLSVPADQGRILVRARRELTTTTVVELAGEAAARVVSELQDRAGVEFGSPPRELVLSVIIHGRARAARVATLRSADGGTTVVIRVPDLAPVLSLDELGMGAESLTAVKTALSRLHGVALFAGATGSGTTSSAYAALLHRVGMGDEAYTLESPVERNVTGAVQVRCAGGSGPYPEQGFRLLTRPAMDTVMYGRVAERTNAQALARKAASGLRALATIHASDSITALLRFSELAQQMLALEATDLVISQRLVRRLNPGWDGADQAKRYAGVARLFEVLIVDDALRSAIMDGAPAGHLRSIVNIQTFADDAQRLIAAGVIDEETATGVVSR